jgi:transcription elongation factor Elf1
MYGDLIVDKGKLKEAVEEEVCPMCGSTEIEDSYGVFISKTRYMQTMVCMACGSQWSVIYDNDLNIVDVSTGG